MGPAESPFILSATPAASSAFVPTTVVMLKMFRPGSLQKPGILRPCEEENGKESFRANPPGKKKGLVTIVAVQPVLRDQMGPDRHRSLVAGSRDAEKSLTAPREILFNKVCRNRSRLAATPYSLRMAITKSPLMVGYAEPGSSS